MSPDQPVTRDVAMEAKAWPFEEARKLLKRVEKRAAEAPVIFQTGFGASGLPHIGTFGEVARTAMVRHAFETIDDHPTRLISFSDDMDGLRKVPTNLPNQDMLAAHLDKPLTKIPDPFGTHESFGHHNNARLRAFLDTFEFDYEFLSATKCYESGRFDETLLKILRNYDKVINIVLPTLGSERQATYSPFLPICAETGNVLQVPVIERNADAGTIVYQREDGKKVETLVTGGACKMQWKADWAMRWVALDVDYEMAGKDLIESVTLSSKITKAIGGTPPEGFNFELFLDDKGQKISKSKGNGLTIDEWLRYASPESLSLYMFNSPRKAKRLYFDVIPKAVDEYIAHLGNYEGQTEEPVKQAQNPVWHIHSGHPPSEHVPLSFNLLLNLVSASHSEDRDVLWGFIRAYDESATPENHPLLDRLVGYAINYYKDFVGPKKTFRPATSEEKAAMLDLIERFERIAAERPNDLADALQTEVYATGKDHGFEPLREWFKALYEVLLGQSQGPRFGSFVALFGVEKTIALMKDKLGA